MSYKGTVNIPTAVFLSAHSWQEKMGWYMQIVNLNLKFDTLLIIILEGEQIKSPYDRKY